MVLFGISIWGRKKKKNENEYEKDGSKNKMKQPKIQKPLERQSKEKIMMDKGTE